MQPLDSIYSGVPVTEGGERINAVMSASGTYQDPAGDVNIEVSNGEFHKGNPDGTNCDAFATAWLKSGPDPVYAAQQNTDLSSPVEVGGHSLNPGVVGRSFTTTNVPGYDGYHMEVVRYARGLKMKILALALSAMFAACIFCADACNLHAQASPGTETDTGKSTQVPSEVSLSRYLHEEGDRLQCYFTVEAKKSLQEPFLNKLVPNKQDVKTVNDLALELRKVLPNTTVVHDNKQSVIHIVGDSLDREKQYVMIHKIKIGYDGPLEGLADTLNKQLNGEVRPKTHFYSAILRMDYDTTVKIKPLTQSVRSLLTNYVPLKGYARIIWSAETDEVNGKPVTEIQYFGHQDRADLSPTPPFK